MLNVDGLLTGINYICYAMEDDKSKETEKEKQLR
jgi:hypothetical protein